MAKTRDYMDYLDEFVEISPANSEEEYQAAGVIAGILKDHELETSVESFETHPAGMVVLPILMCLMFFSLVVMGVTEGSVHYGALVLSVLLAGLSVFSHFSDANIFQNFGPTSQSQNVVAVHRATGDKVVKGARPIVIVAHYDTPRESLMRKGTLARVQTSLPRIVFPLTIAVIVLVLLQAIPVLPNAIRTFLWVLGVLASLPLLFFSVMNIYEHFAPCTQGANDNKSSIAAMLSIANKVRPHEDRVDAFVANGNESLLRRAGDKPPAPPMPTYVEVVEETKGVRHGAEVLASLGILPATCDVVYEEPRVTIVETNTGTEAQEYEDTNTEMTEEPQEDAAQNVEESFDQKTEDDIPTLEELPVEEVPVEEDEDGVLGDEGLTDETAEDYGELVEEAYDEDQDYEEEGFDEEDYGEEVYDEEDYDEDLYADDETPTSIGAWLKDRWSGIREFFSKDRGSDMDIDRGVDRTQPSQEQTDVIQDNEEIGDSDYEPTDEEGNAEYTEYESYDEEDDAEYADYEPYEEEGDTEYTDYEPYDANDVETYGQGEALVDDDEYVYLEDLEPEPLVLEEDVDEENIEDEPEDEPEDVSFEDDGDDAYIPVTDDEVEEEYDGYEEEYVEEEYVEEGAESAQEDEEEYVVAYDDMPTQIIDDENPDEFDLVEEEYQEDEGYEGYSRYEEYEELANEEAAPSFIERIKMFFRDLRESNAESIYEDYDEELEEEGYAEDEPYDEGNLEEEALQSEPEDVEEFEEDDLYYDDTFDVEEPRAEDADIEPYGEVEIESPLPDDFDQPLERPADPNVLHFDYEEDSDILPRDTTGLDTISDSYDLYSGNVDRTTRRDKPVPVEDPSWGVTSYQPARPAVNIARRAALLDLPDPSEAFVDPLSYVGYNGSGFAGYVEDEYDAYATNSPSVDGMAEDANGSEDGQEVAPQPRSMDNVEEPYEDYFEEDYTDLDEIADDDLDWEPEEQSGNETSARKSFWGRGEASSWKGGATSRADLREDEGEPIIIDAEDLKDAILELGDDYLVAHDIWFVATGASATDHAGIKAFMEAHSRDIRGSFLVNLDSIGAGSLSVVVREGVNVSKKADRRLVRMLTGIAQDLHIQVETAMQNWTDHESTITMRSRIRSVTIVGLDENDLPANAHTPSDVPESVNPRQVSNVVRIVTELIRRS